MRILVTNDDGMNAPGLQVLRKIAETLSSDVWIVAPETNQSGVSHSLTIFEPLRYREIGERAFAVRGTPTDCAIMGVRHILAGQPPGLILSGVNYGANLAEDVAYSGTVAGASEGTRLGVRSIAMSLTTGFDPHERIHWETPLAHGPGLVEKLLEAGWPENVVINVNYPDLPPDEVAGAVVARQGRRDQSLETEERRDPWGHPYYWLRSNYRRSTLVEGTDLAANANGLISITPLVLDLTHGPSCETLARAFAGGAYSRAAANG